MSALNCKPGDLAVVVRSMAGNEGVIVRCLRLIRAEATYRANDGSEYNSAVWEIDRPLPDWVGGVDFTFPDVQLRPIRDPGDDARDETLEWLPVPSTTKEVA